MLKVTKINMEKYDKYEIADMFIEMITNKYVTNVLPSSNFITLTVGFSETNDYMFNRQEFAKITNADRDYKIEYDIAKSAMSHYMVTTKVIVILAKRVHNYFIPLKYTVFEKD